jgi:hypothetical protein
MKTINHIKRRFMTTDNDFIYTYSNISIPVIMNSLKPVKHFKTI